MYVYNALFNSATSQTHPSPVNLPLDSSTMIEMRDGWVKLLGKGFEKHRQSWHPHVSSEHPQFVAINYTQSFDSWDLFHIPKPQFKPQH